MTAVDMGPEGATAGNTAVPYGLRWLTVDNKYCTCRSIFEPKYKGCLFYGCTKS